MATNGIEKILGIVAVTPQGEWQNDIEYQQLAVVRYNAVSYIAKQDVPQGLFPSDDSTDYWEVLSKDGIASDFATNDQINGLF